MTNKKQEKFDQLNVDNVIKQRRVCKKFTKIYNFEKDHLKIFKYSRGAFLPRIIQYMSTKANYIL
jgi:hypothetical protein